MFLNASSIFIACTGTYSPLRRTHPPVNANNSLEVFKHLINLRRNIRKPSIWLDLLFNRRFAVVVVFCSFFPLTAFFIPRPFSLTHGHTVFFHQGDIASRNSKIPPATMAAPKASLPAPALKPAAFARYHQWPAAESPASGQGV